MTIHDEQLFDRRLVRQRRDRISDKFAHHNFLFKEVADCLVDRLATMKYEFPKVLDLGGREGYLSGCLLRCVGTKQVLCSDLCFNLVHHAPKFQVVADEEHLPFREESFDLVVSNLSLHCVNDLLGSLIQIRQCLKKDGLFLASIPGSHTLYELRKVFMETEIALLGGITPRIAPFLDIQEAGMLLQRSGFVLPVVDRETITVVFQTPYDLFADLRGMGEANSILKRSRIPLTRKFIHHLVQHYEEQFQASEKGVVASFEILYVSGWVPC